MTTAQKSLLLSRISTIEKALIDAIKEQRRQAKVIMKLMNKSQYEKKWLSTQEVSEITGYKVSSLYQLNQKREITTRKSGSGLQWNRESLDEYLRVRERRSKSELVEEYNKKLKRA